MATSSTFHMFRNMLCALAVLAAGVVTAATPPMDEATMVGLGFKVLVAGTPVQQTWVKSLAPGQIKSLQRNGKKFYVYPDAAKDRIFVGGPRELERYRQLVPASASAKPDSERAHRLKQDEVMRRANARDLSDPFLGASWSDLGW